MLLGIILHVALSFAPDTWIVKDSQQHSAFSLLFAAIHGFRMPLFFLISGYFTAMLWQSRGLKALIKHRFKRIFLPLLLGMVTIIPLTNWVTYKALKPNRTQASQESASDRWNAASSGNLSLLKNFHESGGELDAKHNEWNVTLLHLAAMNGQTETVDWLLKEGASPHIANNEGNTALHVSAFFGREEVVELLLRHDADPNKRNHNGENVYNVIEHDWGTTQFIAGIAKISVKKEEWEQGRAAIRSLLDVDTDSPAPPESTKNNGLFLLLFMLPIFHHLWFLWFLLWLVIGFVISSPFLRSISKKSWFARLTSNPFCWLWIIPLTLIPQSMMGKAIATFGPDTSIGLLPFPHILFYYSIFFGFGALYFLSPREDARLGRAWRMTLPALLLILFPIGLELTKGTFGFGDRLIPQEWQRTLAVAIQVMFAWGMSFASIGMFRELFHRENSRIRYLSDSSYWLYIAHMPLVIALQGLAKDWPLPSYLKFLLICGVTTAILLLSYHYLIRYSWIGRLLNGPRNRPS